MPQPMLSIRRHILSFGKGMIVPLLALLILEALYRAKIASALYFPSVIGILKTFCQLTAAGVLPAEVMASLSRMGLGFALAFAITLPLGVLMGISRRAYYFFEPIIELLRPIPPPLIVPIAIVFMGVGDSMKIVIVAFTCCFPMLTNTIDGVRSVHPLLIATARCFGLSRIQIIRKVIVRSALPQIVSGLRASLPVALIVTVFTEMIGGGDGIGRYIIKMQRTLSVREMYVGILALGIVGILLNKVFIIMDKRMLAWYSGWKRSGK